MTRAAFFRLLAVTALTLTPMTQARAANILVVHDTFFTAEKNNLVGKLIDRGNTPTTTLTVPGGALGGYQQLWDIRVDFFTLSTITAADRAQYVSYLQGGGAMFLMGENASFMDRNNSILDTIKAAGGGVLTFGGTASDVQSVINQGRLPSPIPGNTIDYAVPGGVSTLGTGTCLSVDSNDHCSAIAFPVGSLANAPTGSLVAVFDINFMAPAPGDNLDIFFNNIIDFVTEQATGGGGFAHRAATPYQQQVGTAFDNLFGTTSGELSAIMVNVAGMSTVEEQRNALERAAGSFPQVAFSNAFKGIQANLQDVANWVGSGMAAAAAQSAGAAPMRLAFASVGNGIVMSDASDTNLASLASAVSGNPGWSNGSGLGAFLNLGYIGGDQDATLNQAGFRYNGFAGTGGVSYALTREITIGGAVGINSIASRIDDSRGDSTTGAYNAIAFGRYADGAGLYADLTGNVGYVDYEYDRNVVAGGFAGTAHGETDGWQIGASTGGGYDFQLGDIGPLGVLKRVTAGPFGQMQYQYARLAGYTETGLGTASLKVGDQAAHSLTVRVGGRVTGAIESSLGDFLPSLSVGYERELLNGSRTVSTSFTGGAASFGTPVDKTERNFAVVGIGLNKALIDGFSAGLAYNGRYSLNDRQHAVVVRGKLEF